MSSINKSDVNGPIRKCWIHGVSDCQLLYTNVTNLQADDMVSCRGIINFGQCPSLMERDQPAQDVDEENEVIIDLTSYDPSYQKEDFDEEPLEKVNTIPSFYDYKADVPYFRVYQSDNKLNIQRTVDERNADVEELIDHFVPNGFDGTEQELIILRDDIRRTLLLNHWDHQFDGAVQRN